MFPIQKNNNNTKKKNTRHFFCDSTQLEKGKITMISKPILEWVSNYL